MAPIGRTEIGADAVGAGVATEGNGIQPLAWKTGIAHAIEPGNGGAVEGHRQQTGQAPAGNWSIAAIDPAQKAAVAAGGAHLAMADRGRQARQN